MFVKQIDTKTALELAAKGREIAIMAPSVPEPKVWTDYETETLQGMLEGCLFFRQEPAMEIQKPVAPNSTPRVKKQKKVDVGRIIALHKAGWTNAKIAEDVGVSDVTVGKYIREALAGNL